MAQVSEQGAKHDAGKPRMELLFDGMPDAVEGVAKVLTFGAAKYAAHSWKTVPNNVERYTAALLRHQIAISKGETHDPESGLPHQFHVACNALFLAQLAVPASAGASDGKSDGGLNRDRAGDGQLRESPQPVLGSAGGVVPNHFGAVVQAGPERVRGHAGVTSFRTIGGQLVAK